MKFIRTIVQDTDITSAQYLPYNESESRGERVDKNTNNIVYMVDALQKADIPNFLILVEDVVANKLHIGDVTLLETVAKDNLVNAINEVNHNLKATDSSAITDDSATNPTLGINPPLVQVATNKKDIATNVTNIDKNYNDIGDITTLTTTTKTSTVGAINELKTSTDTNASGIATNKTNIATNVTNIATNVTDIGTNKTNIATNTSGVATNVTAIATNKTNIATNTTNIGTNDTDIENINTKLDTLSNAIVDTFDVRGTYNSSVGGMTSAVEFTPTLTETTAISSAYMTFAAPNKFTAVQGGNFEALIFGSCKIVGAAKTVECRLYKNGTLIETNKMHADADSSVSLGFSMHTSKLVATDVVDIRFYYAESGTISGLGVTYNIAFATITAEGVTSSSKLVNDSNTSPTVGINPQLVKADTNALHIGDWSKIPTTDPPTTDIVNFMGASYAATTQINANVGDLTKLKTTVKTDNVSAINENFDSIATNKTNITANTTNIGSINNKFKISTMDLNIAKGIIIFMDDADLIQMNFDNVDSIEDNNYAINANRTSVGAVIGGIGYEVQWGNHADNIGDMDALEGGGSNLVEAINAHHHKIGDLTLLKTDAKGDLVSAINEVFDSGGSICHVQRDNSDPSTLINISTWDGNAKVTYKPFGRIEFRSNTQSTVSYVDQPSIYFHPTDPTEKSGHITIRSDHLSTVFNDIPQEYYPASYWQPKIDAASGGSDKQIEFSNYDTDTELEEKMRVEGDRWASYPYLNQVTMTFHDKLSNTNLSFQVYGSELHIITDVNTYRFYSVYYYQKEFAKRDAKIDKLETTIKALQATVSKFDKILKAMQGVA